ncbi:hypothetical protein [Polyangium sp. 6x1]|uniref:hypothetical protein n=1 Tax=Polyangium sp. 6x1 TaxID=3042689 RepID=UPI002482C4E7|nr:hypothetical protein [Polyangium sp. 6x1]MDI1445777.1 hypothetical protein [Polyangium sp. 6x1]
MRRWIKQDPAFRESLRNAEAEGEAKLSRVVVKAATKDPRFALDVLRARYPERWGKRRARIETAENVPLDIPPTLPKELRAIWREAAEKHWKDPKLNRELEIYWATGETSRPKQIRALRKLLTDLETEQGDPADMPPTIN